MEERLGNKFGQGNLYSEKWLGVGLRTWEENEAGGGEERYIIHHKKDVQKVLIIVSRCKSYIDLQTSSRGLMQNLSRILDNKCAI